MPTINVRPSSVQQLQAIADTLGKSKKAIVVTGAGISTNCGIPDFRSENGLYSLIQAQYDAALQNPPWETTDSYDIDDRPKKKRRVTDRWYYEVVPGTGTAVQEPDSQLRAEEEPEPRSLHSEEGDSPCRTPARKPTPVSSPLSSPRSITPPSEDFNPEHLSKLPHQRRGAISSQVSLSRSLRSQTSRTSRSSSVFTSEGLPKDTHSQSDSSAPSCSATSDILDIAEEPEEDSQFPSSPPSSISEDSPTEAPPLSQTSSSRTLPNLKGRDLFDSMIWSDPFTTSIFYMFISSLRDKIQNEVLSTTKTHQFIRTLRDSGRLVRNYTQNIDCLEEREGLCSDLLLGPGNRLRFGQARQKEPRPETIDADSPHNGGVEVVLLHGSLIDLRCGICSQVSSWADDRQSSTLAGFAPDCPACVEASSKRADKGRRGLAVGRLRPNIVLYGEEHPSATLIAPLITHDLSLNPDFLLIMGTSLKVHGLKVMVKEFAKAVHGRGGKVVFVNQTKPPESTWGEFIDYWVEWDCDEWVSDLQARRADIWLPQGTRVESTLRRKSTGETKLPATKPPRRPQSIREDRLSGAYTTFKIMDTLRRIRDLNGETASRPAYWDKTAGNAVAIVKAEVNKPQRKSVPATRHPPKVNAKKRKSCPSAIEATTKTACSLGVLALYEKIRIELAPELPPLPSEDAKHILEKLQHRLISANNGMFSRSFGPNHLPVLPGLGTPQKPDLNSHPPRGVTIPIHTPKSAPRAVERISTPHPYGTRASARLFYVSAQTKITVDHASQPDIPSGPACTDDIFTVGVAKPPFTVSSSRAPTGKALAVGTDPTEDSIFFDTLSHQNEQPPTPPAILTPEQRRIKKLGSLDAILSSPNDSANSSDMFYDAES